MSERSHVLHFVQQWLPLSEPFVYGLVTNSCCSGPIVSVRRLENTESFPYDPLFTLSRLNVRSRVRKYLITATLMWLTWRHSVTVVHVHHGYPADDVTGTCRRRGLPLVLSLHGHDVTGLLRRQPSFYASVIPLVDAVVVPSAYLSRVAVAAGFPEERVHVIPSGVDLEQFAPTPLPASREVLFVGRFVEKKGLDVLLAAWPAVRRQVPDARLRILGFGPLEGLARSGGEGVEVVVGPSHQDVRDAMRRAYVVVSPSRAAADDDSVESLLVVNLEAQASGRPLVTTRHGGILEFVRENETAIVVPENDPVALAEALSAVLRDRDLAVRLGSAGPDWVHRFDARRCAERVDELYASVLRDPRRRPTYVS